MLQHSNKHLPLQWSHELMAACTTGLLLFKWSAHSNYNEILTHLMWRLVMQIFLVVLVMNYLTKLEISAYTPIRGKNLNCGASLKNVI